jgi:hypothetical protein
MLQWDFWVVATNDFRMFPFPCFMGRFCDIVVLLFEMLQYIIFNVVVHNFRYYSTCFRCCSTCFQCCTTYFCDVAIHNFRCCGTYFSMLQYMFFDVALHIFTMLPYLYSDVALHIFSICLRCCTWSVSYYLEQGRGAEWGTLGNGDSGAVGNGGQGHDWRSSIPFYSDPILRDGQVWERKRCPDAALSTARPGASCPLFLIKVVAFIIITNFYIPRNYAHTNICTCG